MKKVRILKMDVSTGKAQRAFDYVAVERPLFVYLNKIHYATIYSSPTQLKELAVGHVLSEGIIKSIREIGNITLGKDSVCRLKLKANVNLENRLKLSTPFSRVILSACGTSQPYQFIGKLPRITSALKVNAKVIIESVRQLNFMADTFRKTGGVHIATIYKSDGNLVSFAEDVGRHNAVDKVIGACALDKIDFDNCFLAVSGRLTGDMVLKAGRVGIPIVASLAAALDSGVTLAEDLGLTLVGFVRGKRMNIYTFPERILS